MSRRTLVPLRSGRRKDRASRVRRLFFEPLEIRRVLATITVTSLADNMDIDGMVTLREAIEAANTNTSVDGSEAGSPAGPLGVSSVDEIVFQPGLTGTIDMNGTQFDVFEGQLTITGPGRDLLTIDAHQNSRHFELRSPGLSLILDGMTLTNGRADGNGGSVFTGGASTLVIQNSEIRDNAATNDGGGVYAVGGGVGTSFMLENTRIHNNSAINGGGVYITSSLSVHVTNSTLSQNRASGSGGGLYSSAGALITSSTISGNNAVVGGGGVQLTGAATGVTLDSSTVSGNRAGVSGGGIGVESDVVSLRYSTVVRNEVTSPTGEGGGIFLVPQTGLPNGDFARLSVVSSIVAQNSAAVGPDLTAPENTNGASHSLIGSNAGTFFPAAPVGSPSSAGNLIGIPGAEIDPKLGTLRKNGGPAETHGLLPDSPALEASYDPVTAAILGVPDFDQRGFPRQENRMDMGAFELTQPVKFFDNHTFALWANNVFGFAESPISVFHNGQEVGNQPYQVIELFHAAAGNTSFPLIFADLVGNTFSRLTYLREDGNEVPFGTSTVGSASFRTSDQRFHFLPVPNRADITTGGEEPYQSLLSAGFGALADVSVNKSWLSAVAGSSTKKIGTRFEALQNISLATGNDFSGNDRFRLFTASSMFNDEQNFDADVLRYEDTSGTIQTLVLSDLTPTNSHLFPSAIEIGSWFELAKTAGSDWFATSPTTRVTIDDKHGLRLGLQGYLLDSDNNNDDSLSVWLEWLDAPDTVTAGTTLDVDLTVEATPPGTPGITVEESDGDTSVSESGSTDTITVVLDAQPRSNVVIDVTSDDTGEAVVNPATLIFTPADWDQLQTVTITGVPDDQIDGDQTSTITLEIDQSASAGAYQSVGARTVGVTTVNIDQPAVPVITWTDPSDITFGTALDSVQLNATADVPGTFIYSPASGTVLDAGASQTLSVTFTPNDTVNFTQATADVTLNVLKANPMITWSDPAAIVFGTTLDASQLNAEANVAGTFSYAPASGTLLEARENQTLSVTFTPADSSNYNEATAEVAIDVLKADPLITWSDPAEITFGAALDASQLNAEANVAGLLTYNPDHGTVLDAGDNQTLSVTFTPSDMANYNEATSQVAINVLKANPIITWNDPADITFGTALDDLQLNAEADVDGAFSYDPVSGAVLNAGANQVLSVTFTPGDTENYNEVTADVTIDVVKADPVITWNDPADISFGTALGASQLNAGANVAGTFQYNPDSGAVLNAGANQTLSVLFIPTDAANYNDVTTNVVIDVLKADPAVTWSDPDHITFGTALGNSQLNAEADVPGTFAYVPASGTVLNGGTDQTLSVTFTPADPANYNEITADVTIDVLKADPVITWDEPSEITFGTALDASQLNAESNVAGIFFYSPNIGTVLNAGFDQTLSVSFAPTETTNYNEVSAEVAIDVLKADPVITWEEPDDITLGTPLSDGQLNATSSVPGTFVYTPPVGTELGAGESQTLDVSFTPADATNYNAVTASVEIDVIAVDFGDAPAPYPVTKEQGGASHILSDLFLGERIDPEADGQPDDAAGQGAAGGDDNNGDADEDGVALVTTIISSASAVTTASLSVTSSSNGKLNAWMDLNGNGTWNDPGDQIITDRDLVSGLNVLSFSVPAGTAIGDAAARFRVSSTNGLGPTGAAPDGEVEDYIVTVLDGASSPGVTATITPPISGTFDVAAEGNDIVVRRDASELFRSPGESLASLVFKGSTGNDTLRVADLDAVFAGLVGGDAGEGDDTLLFTGAGQELDLTIIPDNSIQGLEAIDIIGDGDNTLKLDVGEVLNMSASGDTVRVLANRGDEVEFGSGWVMTGVEAEDGVFYRVLQQQGATLLLHGPNHWQNPIWRNDTNNDGTLDPVGDILRLINEINNPRFTTTDGRLPSPTVADFPGFYDVNGDGSLTTNDILQNINLANSQASSESESPPGWARFAATTFAAAEVGPRVNLQSATFQVQRSNEADRMSLEALHATPRQTRSTRSAMVDHASGVSEPSDAEELVDLAMREAMDGELWMF